MESDKINDVLILGAGMTGISAGNYLLSYGADLKILDKGRSPGGRMATKRIDHYGDKVTFDYGCRYLIVKNETFEKALKPLDDENRLKAWNIDEDNHLSTTNIGAKKIIGKNSMRDIALKLSDNLEILNNNRISNISWNGDFLEVFTEKGSKFNSYSLLLTMPVPQIIDIMSSSKIEIPIEILTHLREVTYYRSIVGMFILDSESKMSNKGGLEFQQGDISFITDNNLKGINKHKTAITIEMTDEFSRKNWNLSDEEISSKIITAAKGHLNFNIIDYRIHRWKFSKPSKPYNKKFECLQHPAPIFLAGDAFGGSSVESAFISGLQAAAKIKDVIMTLEKVELK